MWKCEELKNRIHCMKVFYLFIIVVFIIVCINTETDSKNINITRIKNDENNHLFYIYIIHCH